MEKLPVWQLSQLADPQNPQTDKRLENLAKKAAALKAKREELDNISPEKFKVLIEDLTALSEEINLISAFAGLWFAQDTQNQKAISFMAKTQNELTKISNDLLFFELWWQNLSAEISEPLLAMASDFNYWLKRLVSFQPYTKTEAEEKIINLKNLTGADALITLYDSLTNRYQFSSQFLKQAKIKVSKESLNREELMLYARHHQAEVRKGAYQQLYKVYGEDGPILGQIYQNIVRDWRTEYVDLRNYSSPILVRHKRNDLSEATIDALLETCKKKSNLFNRFFKLKAKTIGLENFSRYDLYAPLEEDNSRYSFSEGLSLVKEAFNGFNPQMAKLAENVILSNRFSAEVRPGKQGGAFCASTTPKEIPWVLMSYQGRQHDLFTMAHELGHAVHSQLASNHNVFHFHATLPLAETASTFGELLLAQSLREKASPKAKAGLLFKQLDDAYATIGRQAFFALFEIQAHQMIEQGATVDDLADAYYENLKLQFGQEIEIPKEFQWEWVSIPHIYHSPFYVYAYAFGQLLVYALWQAYQNEGQKTAIKIMNILSAGGSKAPEVILAENGFDVTKADFWEQGFKVIENMVMELEQLAY